MCNLLWLMACMAIAVVIQLAPGKRKVNAQSQVNDLFRKGYISGGSYIEMTDSISKLSGVHTYPAMSVSEISSGCYTVQATGTALNRYAGNLSGDAIYERRTLGHLLHFYRDLRHQATQTTLMKHNTDQSHPIRRAFSRLAQVPLKDVIDLQHDAEISVLICLCLLGLSENASIDDLLQANHRDWAKQLATESTTRAYDWLLNLDILPAFVFSDTPSTIELSEQSISLNGGMFDELTLYEDYLTNAYL
ncbi:hypothetical protein HD553DRAFT_356109 [Filobasidium floriforme]|uniref:uncharacterized protein n=1 Tax=Filobasidium floriforme TaxID=5210 RepID=UPI001E8DAC97|nr:uncharacterized protein HD553DRAFT_356109 [Filobasidium floriforme]KAH8084081.1 hypothetical protein HD553DRAFT_356109 [Filobasidium floriforme]